MKNKLVNHIILLQKEFKTYIKNNIINVFLEKMTRLVIKFLS
jgi:hypothetical protein